MRQWIADLGDSKYAVREEAQKRLAGLGELAHGALQQAKPDSAEARRRIAKLLEQPQGLLPAERARPLRAVRALALADTPEARAVLREWAAGADGAALTRAAKLALDRK